MHSPAIPPVVSEPGNLSVKFSISRWDLLQCRLWAITQNRFVVGLILFFSAAVPLLNFPKSKDSAYPVLFSLFLCFLIGAGLMFCFMVFIQVAVQVAFLFSSKNRGVLGEQELEIRSDALIARSSISESVNRWAGFQKLRSAGGFLFLYVGGNIVHYVPLRSFPSPAAAEHFKNEIRRHTHSAK